MNKDTIKQELKAVLDEFERQHFGYEFPSDDARSGALNQFTAGWYAALAALEAEQPASEAQKLTDAEIIEWATRHDLKGSVGDLRCIAEDAATIHLCRDAAPSASAAVQPQAKGPVIDLQHSFYQLIMETYLRAYPELEPEVMANDIVFHVCEMIRESVAAAPVQPASKPEGYFTKHSEFGPWVEVEAGTPGAIPLTRCATSSKEASDAAQEYTVEERLSHRDRQLESAYEQMNTLRQQLIAAQAAQPVQTLIKPDEMAAFKRFQETCDDGEGYDLPAPMMQRLASIGLIRHCGGARYKYTDFGQSILAPECFAAPAQPCRDDVLEEAARLCDELANGDIHFLEIRGYESSAAAIRALRTQPAQQDKGDKPLLHCKKCGVDRAKEYCPRNGVNCGFTGVAQGITSFNPLNAASNVRNGVYQSTTPESASVPAQEAGKAVWNGVELADCKNCGAQVTVDVDMPIAQWKVEKQDDLGWILDEHGKKITSAYLYDANRIVEAHNKSAAPAQPCLDGVQVSRATLDEFIDKFCMATPDLISVAESAFYAFNRALRTQPAQQTEPSVPAQAVTLCHEELRKAGKAATRRCQKCGYGPCHKTVGMRPATQEGGDK